MKDNSKDIFQMYFNNFYIGGKILNIKEFVIKEAFSSLVEFYEEFFQTL